MQWARQWEHRKHPRNGLQLGWVDSLSAADAGTKHHRTSHVLRLQQVLIRGNRCDTRVEPLISDDHSPRGRVGGSIKRAVSVDMHGPQRSWRIGASPLPSIVCDCDRRSDATQMHVLSNDAHRHDPRGCSWSHEQMSVAMIQPIFKQAQ